MECAENNKNMSRLSISAATPGDIKKRVQPHT